MRSLVDGHLDGRAGPRAAAAAGDEGHRLHGVGDDLLLLVEDRHLEVHAHLALGDALFAHAAPRARVRAQPRAALHVEVVRAVGQRDANMLCVLLGARVPCLGLAQQDLLREELGDLVVRHALRARLLDELLLHEAGLLAGGLRVVLVAHREVHLAAAGRRHLVHLHALGVVARRVGERELHAVGAAALLDALRDRDHAHGRAEEARLSHHKHGAARHEVGADRRRVEGALHLLLILRRDGGRHGCDGGRGLGTRGTRLGLF